MSATMYLGKHKVLKPLANNVQGSNTVRQYSSPASAGSRNLAAYKPTKNRQKPKLDRNSLMSYGSIKFAKLNIPYFETTVPAGYPTWVDDPFRRHLDLSAYLISHPKSVYYFKVAGYSMVDAGISHKDLLVVDTALSPKHRDIIIAVVNGEFKLKRFLLEGSQIKLLSANPDYPAITITDDMNFFVQGVVTTVIRTFNPSAYDNNSTNISYPQF